MGFLDRLLGRVPSGQQRPTGGGGWGAAPAPDRRPAPTGGATGEDERALARYRYLLRTASPDQVEAVHAEAFARLTADQRRLLLEELARTAPAGERVASDQPADLARAATRAELRSPGYLESTLGRRGFGGGAFAGVGLGSSFAGSMLGTVAGFVVASAVADVLFDGFDSSPEAQDLAAGGTADTSADEADVQQAADTGTGSDTAAGGDGGWDAGAGAADGAAAGDAGGGWFGGDSGGGFSDFGGGGGDFGGGDMGGF